MWSLFWAAVLVLVGLLALRSLRLLREHSLSDPDSGAGTASLSVILTARNEASRIQDAIYSVLAQDHPELELVVVDDRSSDETLEIALRAAETDPRVRVLHAETRPSGWQGRLHAQALGVEASRGRWLFFFSADQRLTSPTVLRGAIAECETRELDAITVLGRFVGNRWWERFWFHPIIDNPVVWGAFLAISQLGRSVWLVGALTMRRATYDELGGVRAALDCGAGGYDDLGWSRTFTARGKRAQLLVSRNLEDVSNWESFQDFLHGLTRWCVGIFTYRSGGWVAAAALGALIALAYVALARSALDLLSGRPPEPAGIFALGVALVIGAAHCRWNRLPLRFAPLFLVVGIEVLVIFALTAWAGLRNRASWRDDELAVRVPPPR